MAAYYYLPRGSDQKSVRTRRVEPGLIVDFGADGQAIGIEILACAITPANRPEDALLRRAQEHL